MTVTQIDILRHGRVLTPNLFCAPSTEPLSAEGWQQLSTATERYRPDQILSSPSLRCAQFAEHFSSQSAIPLQIEPRIQEMNFGTWIGKTSQTIWETDQVGLQQLWSDPLSFTSPQGESMPAFIQRVTAVWDELIQRYAGKQILLMTHGGVIRVLLAQSLGINYAQTLRFELGYGQAVRFRVYADGRSSVCGLGLERLLS
ncbi:histidine phosphatase family protein [uncultured Thiothrix sp.]|jgi:broad specificity phosphatase PhoE|uniref:histidine phosphatase family protein n=1 Tax=uncultured Thiothrix sp. TaxID=223185 RepID=UPI00260922DE|nr:histidine phosphatase family protein [uncultured Thiothrix sp.]HMT91616.1 histidine phosphatase family protein [Thiolinea sp.]